MHKGGYDWALGIGARSELNLAEFGSEDLA